jgi:hypothetical protein
MRAFNKDFETINLHHPTVLRRRRAVSLLRVLRLRRRELRLRRVLQLLLRRRHLRRVGSGTDSACHVIVMLL